uniref:Odorant receptor n=1 Tax=Histia rhodope TaxID=1453155 RepID=A0A7G4KBV2_9NEOP|nr:odorant receptor [Histia rhodope]
MKNSECLSASIAILKVTGVWWSDSMVYKIIGSLIQLFLYVFTVLAEIAYVLMVLGDTERTVDAAVLLLSHLVQGVKVATVWFRQRRIKGLIKLIDGPNFEKTDLMKAKMIESFGALLKLSGHLFLSTAAVTALFWVIVPMLKSEITLPLKTAYPFDINDPGSFTLMYGYTTISVVLVGVGDAAENYLLAALLILPTIHLEILCQELQELDHGDDIYERTVSCIKYHQHIIEYANEVASVFGIIMFCQFVTSSVIICMTLFKITITTEPIEMITMVFYLVCVCLELFLYCYAGDLLMNKSLLVSEASFPGKWLKDTRSCRALLMTTVRAQRPLIVKAGGVFTVSLPTAAAIMQTAYSYYAVLQQKTKEHN